MLLPRPQNRFRCFLASHNVSLLGWIQPIVCRQRRAKSSGREDEHPRRTQGPRLPLGGSLSRNGVRVLKRDFREGRKSHFNEYGRLWSKCPVRR